MPNVNYAKFETILTSFAFPRIACFQIVELIANLAFCTSTRKYALRGNANDVRMLWKLVYLMLYMRCFSS